MSPVRAALRLTSVVQYCAAWIGSAVILGLGQRQRATWGVWRASRRRTSESAGGSGSPAGRLRRLVGMAASERQKEKWPAA